MLRDLPMFRPSARFIKVLALFAVFLATVIVGAHHAEAQEWALNNANSRITVEGRAGVQMLMGEFKHFQAEIRFDPEEPQDAEVAASIDINSISTGIKDIDMTLIGPQWFDTRNYPVATFRSVSLREIDDDNFELTADITIKGQTKRLLLPVQFENNEGEAIVRTEAYLDRLEFGVGTNEPISGVLIDRNVRITVVLSAQRLDN
ncbi:MAG: YceI family protein [Alphaproteobacteria bacterium]